MKGKVIKKKIALIIIVTLFFSFSLFLASNQQIQNQNPLTIPTQQISPTNSANSKMGNHLQYLIQTSDPSTEDEIIIFFEKTVNYTQGINLLKNLGDFKIISNYTLLGGVCIRAPIGMAPIIAQQNYVRSVTYNERVKIASDQITVNEIKVKDINVNDIIGATTLQNSYGLNGTGVVVAVIDTGINPHKDLPGSRIIYNNSFVPNETYQDLNGHGTAVAGIIGASGTFATGVAPNVTFLNLKALNQEGKGELDWVLQAINAALTMHPKPDIISMSLGGEGSSQDDMCMALNSAWIDNDIIVVVAAGNEGGRLNEDNTYDGPHYKTISSPGLAANIITVGATGGISRYSIDYSSIAYFSSRGPTDDDRAKPDIVAPGRNLISLSRDGNQYVTFSGTSAATPVVAGAIALLLDSNSGVSWISPNTVKAAIMMTAEDLGENPFAQGTGQINISGAYTYLRDYYITGSNDTPPLVITPIRALAYPMFLTDLIPTSVVLTVVVGNITGNQIINASFSVNGNAADFTTLNSSFFSLLNDTQEYVSVSFIVPFGRSARDFSGNLTLVNGSGKTLYVIPLALYDASFLEWPVSVFLLFLTMNNINSGNNKRNLIYIGIGLTALGLTVTVGIVLTMRRVRELETLRRVEAQNELLLLLLSNIPLNYCPYCGVKLQPDNLFCYNCGKQIRVFPPQHYLPK